MNDLVNKSILAVVLVAILAIVGYYVWYEPQRRASSLETAPGPTASATIPASPLPTPFPSATALSPSGEPVFCTQDAMECPDGSFVGRVGPNCEFAPCPAR